MKFAVNMTQPRQKTPSVILESDEEMTRFEGQLRRMRLRSVRLCRVQASNNGVRSTACFGKLTSSGSIFTQAALLFVQMFPIGSAQSMLSSVPARDRSQAGADGDQVRMVKDDRTIRFILALMRHVGRNPPRLIAREQLGCALTAC
jgi:hypothetical protein